MLSPDSEVPDELLYGRAGYLYALLYVNKEISPNTVDEGTITKVTRAHTHTLKPYLPYFSDYKSLRSTSRISQKMRYKEEKNIYGALDYKSHLFRNCQRKIQDQEQTFNLERLKVIQLHISIKNIPGRLNRLNYKQVTGKLVHQAPNLIPHH